MREERWESRTESGRREHGVQVCSTHLDTGDTTSVITIAQAILLCSLLVLRLQKGIKTDKGLERLKRMRSNHLKEQDKIYHGAGTGTAFRLANFLEAYTLEATA